MGFLGAATSAILCIARTTHCERVLRIEVVVHNTQELQCVRSLEKFPQIALQAKVILERFMDALSCGAQNPRALDRHYDTIRTAMQAVFQELGLTA